MTDTDSLCYHIETEDFYANMKQDIHKYDMSNFDYEKLAHFKDNSNKKQVGLGETRGRRRQTLERVCGSETQDVFTSVWILEGW